MPFEWDKNKNKINLEKHGISFEEAHKVFSHDRLGWLDKRKDYSEQRLITIGSLGENAIVVVAYTIRNQNIRIISARIAKQKERRLYHDYTKKKTK